MRCQADDQAAYTSGAPGPDGDPASCAYWQHQQCMQRLHPIRFFHLASWLTVQAQTLQTMQPTEKNHSVHADSAPLRTSQNLPRTLQRFAALACCTIAGTFLYPANAFSEGSKAKLRSARRPTSDPAIAVTYENQIKTLQARVDALEAQLNAVIATSPTPVITFGTGNAASDAAAVGAASSSASAPVQPPISIPVRPDDAGSAAEAGNADTAFAAPVAQATAPVTAPSTPATGKALTKTAGSFDIDEESAQRALERTLSQSGALLLAPGTFEVSPGFQYSRNEQSSALLITFPAPVSGGQVTSITQNRIRRNEFTARADVRVGLPMNAQAEFGLPVTRLSSTQQNGIEPETSSSISGIGDVSVGIAKTLMREKGVAPDLIGRLTYTIDTSRQRNSLQTGAGVNQLQAELVAVKRQDPLAFVGSIAYAKTFEKDGLKPGDGLILSLSTLLAASPATSLQLGFTQIVRAKQKIAGVTLDGSKQSYGVVNLGASSVLSRDTTLVTQFSIGLGNDAPKYSVGISLPILFR